ncbi:hypothetical protein PFISCL1PPCAC_16379, partial [Pristionchus fissidentatus]
CSCSRGYIGQRCEQPYDPHVFAAPLEVGGRSHTSLPLMSFFAALSLLTLGAALFLYKRLMREEQWELTESANTPFSNRTSSSIHRRNALCHSPFFSPDHTCLNPALSKKPGLNLNESTIEYALDATISSMVMEHHREVLSSKNHSQRFLITPEDAASDCFDRQYYHFYNARIGALKSRVEANARKHIDANVVVRRLEDLVDEESALVIGTIEKRIESRPSVLKEIAEDEQKMVEADDDDTAPCSMLSKTDFIEFEDETQIVKLSGKIDMAEVSTGSIVGLYGKMVKENLFEVERLVWPSPARQHELPEERPPYSIAFISGLNLSSAETASKTRSALDLLVRWITGCGMGESESEKALRVIRLVICGSSISAPDMATEMSEMARSITREEPVPDQVALTTVDELISTLVKSIEVDLLPGLGDPSPCLLPQQPLPRCAFSKGGTSGYLRLHTNPSDVTIGGIDFIISSGQNVSDISTSPVDALSIILKSQHISPTCPDTVDGFPFEDRDPFVIDRCFPHVVIAGNQARAEHKQVEFDDGISCLLVGVSCFSESHSITLLDLETMEVTQKHFGFE